MKPQARLPARTNGFVKDIFMENGKWSLGRIMLIMVFLSMVSLWWVASLEVIEGISPPQFVTDNIHLVFGGLLSYAGITKFKTPISNRLSTQSSQQETQ